MIFILFAIVLFTSCEPTAVREGRKIYKAYFNHILKDPSSLEVYSEKYTVEDNNFTVHWELDYGARNSYGGMVRDYIKFTTVGSRLIDIDDLYGGELYSWGELQ